MKIAIVLTLAVLTAGSVTHAQRGQKKPAPKIKTTARKTAVKATTTTAYVKPRPENEFITVDEVIKAKRARGTAVSVEGYAVIGGKVGSELHMSIVDSVDHVLSKSDADKFAREGIFATVTAVGLRSHSKWAFENTGMKRFAMYAGPKGHATANLHDVVAKLRITGLVGADRKSIVPVGKIEFMDDNGDWKAL